MPKSPAATVVDLTRLPTVGCECVRDTRSGVVTRFLPIPPTANASNIGAAARLEDDGTVFVASNF